jgi:hypothetical protein
MTWHQWRSWGLRIWTIEEANAACFIVKDKSGQARALLFDAGT